MSARPRPRAVRSAREVWDDAVAKASERMEDITTRFAESELSEAEYVLSMRSLVKSLHMGALAVAADGAGNVRSSELRRLGPLLRDEYRHIQRKVGRIQTGASSAEAEVARVSGYAVRALGTYERARADRAPKDARGRWRTSARESCPDCQAQEDRGEQVLSSFPRHGSLQCGHHCRCSLVEVA